MGETNLQTHLSEDALELYSLGRMQEPELDAFEQHLLACASCQDRLAETDQYLLAVKEATSRLDRELVEKTEKANTSSSWLSGWAKPAWAAGAALAAAAIMLPVFTSTVRNPVAVELYATRGAEAAVAKADAALELKVDTTGIVVAESAILEVVDLSGVQKWQGKMESKNGGPVVSIPSGLDAGRYWVRLYSDAGKNDLIREFSLSVQ